METSFYDMQALSVNPTEPEYVARAAAILRTQGFVIVNSALTDSEAANLHAMCRKLESAVQAIDEWGLGNRGPGRYCMHNVQRYQNCWNYDEVFAKTLADNCNILPILNEVMGSSSGDWQYCTAGGDYVVGNTPSWQDIHSDCGCVTADDFDILVERQRPPVIMASYVPHAHHSHNGPLMIASWQEMLKFGKREPPPLHDLPEKWKHWARCRLFPLQKGACVLRDVRVWHAGTPNVSNDTRFMPGVLAVRNDCMWPHGDYTWPQRTLARSQFQTLSPEAQQHLHRVRRRKKTTKRSHVEFHPFTRAVKW